MFDKSSIYNRSISKSLATLGTEWRFNPPSAPHFGGIWEAAVKSTKYHVKRVIGQAKLTFEELSTLLCQVEACLNARPLMPLSDDPNDYQALTPAHFLIHSVSYLIPEPDLSEEKIPALKRWKQIQQMLHHFWHRWSKEYLPSLQLRIKWTQPQTDISIGDLVLLRSEITPPARWPLARVTATHPGDDQRVRVVTVRTPENIFKRPITKLVRIHSSSDINN